MNRTNWLAILQWRSFLRHGTMLTETPKSLAGQYPKVIEQLMVNECRMTGCPVVEE